MGRKEQDSPGPASQRQSVAESAIEYFVDRIVGSEDLSAVEHAAVYIENALHSRPFVRLETKKVRAYQVATHSLMKNGIMIVAVAIFIMGFIEDNFRESDASWVPSVIEFGLVSVPLLESLLRFHYLGGKIFAASPWNISRLVASIIFLLDCIATWIIAGAYGKESQFFQYRPTSFLRSYFLVDCNRRVRMFFVIVLQTIVAVIPVAFLVGLFTLYSALVAVVIFGGTTNGLAVGNSIENTGDFFDNISGSMFQLLVLLTSSNFPDVMMPYYSKNTTNVIFFIVFIAVGICFLLQLILAIIYNVYNKSLHDHTLNNEKEKRKAIISAYNLLVEGETGLDLEKWNVFHKKLFPGAPPHQGEAIFRMFSGSSKPLSCSSLDITGLDRLTAKDFINASDCLRMKLVLKRFPPTGGWPLKFFNVQQKIRGLVANRVFSGGIDMLLFTNIILTTVAISGRDTSALTVFVSVLDFIFLSELAMKIIARWPSPFRTETGEINWGHILDTCVILTAVIIDIASDRGRVKRFVSLMRTARLLRLLNRVRQFKIIYSTLSHVLPSLIKFLALLLSVFSIFAVIGVACFKDCFIYFPDAISAEKYPLSTDWQDVQDGISNVEKFKFEFRINPKDKVPCWLFPSQLGEIFVPAGEGAEIIFTTLPCTFLNLEFAQTRQGQAFDGIQYWRNNFNTLDSAFVVLFEIMIVNNWQVIAQAFMQQTGRAALIYFLIFYILSAIVMMSLVIALVLEAFLMNWTAATEKLPHTAELENRRRKYNSLVGIVPGLENYTLAKDRDSTDAFFRNIFWEEITKMHEEMDREEEGRRRRETGEGTNISNRDSYGVVSPYTENDLRRDSMDSCGDLEMSLIVASPTCVESFPRNSILEKVEEETNVEEK